MTQATNNGSYDMDDLELNDVRCHECGRPISTIPSWLSSVKVKIQCEECRQKHPRVPGLVDAEPRLPHSPVEDLNEYEVVEDVNEEEVEEDTVEDVEDYSEE
jgi:hypothetical protein